MKLIFDPLRINLKPMTRNFILAVMAIFLIVPASFAQNSNAVLFSEQGEPFYLILNGLRMNDEPMTNIKVEDLNQQAYKLKIIFEDKGLGDMDKNLYLQPGEESVYMIKKNKKGEYKLSFRSSVAINQAPPAAPQTQVVVWNPNPQPVENTTVVEETVTTTTTNGGTSMGTSTTTGSGDNVSMSVNVDGFNMNVNINEGSNGTSMDMNSGTNMTTTTTTTTTTSGGVAEEVYVEEAAPCAMMSPADFSSAKGSIKSKSFSDSKMTLAKQITRNNCLSAVQVKDIVGLFDFEDDRLDYAKFAYDFCYEQNKYYQINDAFQFESTIEELDEYISGR